MSGPAPRVPFLPIPLVEVDLPDAGAQPEPAPNARGEVLLRVLDRGWPVAQGVETGLRDRADVRRRAELVLRREESFRPPGWRAGDAPATGAPVTVVVCTLGADPGLRAAVDLILSQTYADIDLVVVDNAPETGGADALLGGVGDPRLRIVREPRRGLSVARNTGLAHARGEIVAFTDDDAVPDRRWVAELVRAFAADPDSRLACVTGLVLPAELETEAQALFEECSGFAKGFRAMHWSVLPATGELAALTVPGKRGAAFPYSGGDFGSGNNMAFRTAALRALGGFDVALGAGSATRGGEDLDIFRRVYLAGMRLVYHPAAMVGHRHRREMEALRTQMYGYGTGMAAVVTKVVLGGGALPIARRLPGALSLLLRRDSAKNARKSPAFPGEVTRAELRGYLLGPGLYLKARRAARRRGLAATAEGGR
ncbi:MAG: glycosyltransferase family 2 protein [Thermoleophilia bacterium]